MVKSGWLAKSTPTKFFIPLLNYLEPLLPQIPIIRRHTNKLWNKLSRKFTTRYKTILFPISLEKNLIEQLRFAKVRLGFQLTDPTWLIRYLITPINLV